MWLSHLGTRLVPLPYSWPVEMLGNEGKHILSCQRPRSHTRDLTTALPAREPSSAPHLLAREKKKRKSFGVGCPVPVLALCPSCPLCLTFPNPVSWTSVRSSSIELSQEDHPLLCGPFHFRVGF